MPPVIVDGVDILDSDLDRAYDAVTAVALESRLDLMNARAEVHDAWRKITVFANSLLGTFNVAYHLDSSTPPDQARPFAFQSNRTRHQLILNMELPLVRTRAQRLPPSPHRLPAGPPRLAGSGGPDRQ